MADIRRPLKKFAPHFLKAREESLNEADTVQRIILFLHEVLGYDQLTEITRESQIKEKYVDIAVKVDGAIRFLIEAKSAGTQLRTRHLDQAEMYAAEGNHPWVVLTNGVAWHLYHLTFDEGIEYQQVFEVDLSVTEIDRAADLLGLLHKAAVVKGLHEDFLRQLQACNPESLGRALFSYDVLRVVRREVRRKQGLLLDIEDLANAIKNLFSVETRESIGVIRIRRPKKASKKTAGGATASAPPATPGPASMTATT